MNKWFVIRATGVVTMKVGKVAACAIGGGIILMQIAAHQGYIKINWDKIMRKAEKISDKVEEKITGEGPNLMDKVCAKFSFLLYFTLNKVEDLNLKQKHQRFFFLNEKNYTEVKWLFLLKAIGSFYL